MLKVEEQQAVLVQVVVAAAAAEEAEEEWLAVALREPQKLAYKMDRGNFLGLDY